MLDSTVVEVTPLLAGEWLALSTHNRVLTRTRINRYAETMKRGEWRLTGEAVIFNQAGELIQGHHRCQAAIESGASFTTAVIRGVENDIQLVTDSGKGWSFSDHLSARGEIDFRGLAGAVGWVWRYQNHDLMTYTGTPQPSELMQVLNDNPNIRNGLALGRRIREKAQLSAPVVAGSFYIAGNINAEDAEDFYSKLESGQDLHATSPILLLRNWTGSSYARNGVIRVQQRTMSAVICKAWNAWRAGNEMKVLAWRQGGKSPEQFPEMR